MSVRTGQANLTKAAKALLTSWQRTKEYWRDENSQRFEDEVLGLLQAELRKADPAMTHIEGVLNQVRADCS